METNETTTQPPSPVTISKGSPTLNGLMVSLSIKMWTARKHDRAISQEVAREHAANAAESDKIGRYNKVLIERTESDAYSALEKLRTKARTRFYELTLPMSIEGQQILPAGGLDAFEAEFNQYRWDFERLADDFARDYPEILRRAPLRLNGLFKRDDYPEPSQIRRRFDFAWRPLPIPDAAHFGLPSISMEQEQRLRHEIETSMRDELARAARDPWERVYRVVSTMADKLRGYGVDREGKATGIFRDTLVGNVETLADILPRLNLLGDPDLDAMADRLTSDLCRWTAGELRDDTETRVDTARAAESILVDLAQYEPAKAA